jgi:NAD(P)H-hydrate epimerase
VVAHKGSFGHALIIAGSVGYSGAAVLAARAASRARPGLVSVLTPPDNWLPVSCQLASAMVHPFLPRHPLCSKASAILAGPGLADAALPPDLRAEILRLWREFPGVMIVDASALDWLRPGTPCAGTRVITPHPGEAARLLGVSSHEIQEDRPGSLRRLAARHEAWVVLKGHQTLIGSVRGPLFVNSSGNPGLAQGGTGDVLAGFLTGLLAQPQWNTDLSETLRRGVWCHGVTADRLESAGNGWTAEDLAHALSLNG